MSERILLEEGFCDIEATDGVKTLRLYEENSDLSLAILDV